MTTKKKKRAASSTKAKRTAPTATRKLDLFDLVKTAHICACKTRLTKENSKLTGGDFIHVGCTFKHPTSEDVKVDTKTVMRRVALRKSKPQSEWGKIAPFVDWGSHCCIQVERADGRVKFITLNITGLAVSTTTTEVFDRRFKEILNHPVDKACAQFVEYALHYGSTSAVLDWLGRVVHITQEEYDMAGKKTVTKNGEEKSGSGRKGSDAITMLKELIMASTMTDAAIFKKVQDKFGLDDKKRSYVNWYRWDMKRKGLKVPEPKKDPKAVKEKAAKKPAKVKAAKVKAKKVKAQTEAEA